MCAMSSCLARCGSLAAGSLFILALAVFVQKLVLHSANCEVDSAGVCKRTLPAGSVTSDCGAGVWVELAKQPSIALLHVPVGIKRVMFATSYVEGGYIGYSLKCSEDGRVEVHPHANNLSKKLTPEPLGDMWQVCATLHNPLKLTLPLVDLTFDVPTLPDQAVDGCIRISIPGRYPQLSAVRGSFDQQRESIMSKKAEVGDCPTYTSEESRLERSEDYATKFGQVNAFFVRQVLKHAKDMVLRFKNKEFQKLADLKSVALLAAIAGTSGGHSGMTWVFSTIYCGMPGPSLLPVVGLQVTRHASVAKLISDPSQKRTHQIGGGNAEFCFEPTLPVFLSAGEPLHNQARKLFDEAVFATIDQRDIPEIVPPTETTFSKVRKFAMNSIGMTFPMMDELALYVTPLFLEMLWDKKPSAEEAGAIAAYGSVGGPCIMSQVLEKLPILPGKIIAVREAARTFALDSPTAKAMGGLLEKPEFAELRALFAARPHGVLESAVAALADVSLFAGLIGTSTMTMNGLMVISRGATFLEMFRQNSTAFLLEVMRTLPAVAGSIQVLKEPWKTTTLGIDIEIPAGERLNQLTGMSAGLDAAVFPDPFNFDSNRPNLGEVMTFNGLAKYSLNRNYTGAPRFCPGTSVSIKIAAKVIHYFTDGMPGK